MWREKGVHWGSHTAYTKLFNALEISVQDAIGYIVKKITSPRANTFVMDRSVTLPGVTLHLQNNLKILAGRAMTQEESSAL